MHFLFHCSPNPIVRYAAQLVSRKRRAGFDKGFKPSFTADFVNRIGDRLTFDDSLVDIRRDVFAMQNAGVGDHTQSLPFTAADILLKTQDFTQEISRVLNEHFFQ